MEVIFLGTPQFAVPTLEGIVAAGHSVIAVYTQPDRPKGRGQHTANSPVKESALKLGLTVNSLNSGSRLRILTPTLIKPWISPKRKITARKSNRIKAQSNRGAKAQGYEV